MQGVHGQAEQHRAQQHLRPVLLLGPAVHQSLVRAAPGHRVDHGDGRGPGGRVPVGRDVDDARVGGAREQHGAEQVPVHHLRGAQHPAPGPGEVAEQGDARRVQRGGGPGNLRERLHLLTPRRPVGQRQHRGVDAPGRGAEEAGAGQPGGGGVQPPGHLDHLVVPGLGLTGQERVRRPPGDHPAPVGGADRPGHPQPLHGEGLAHPRRPGGPGVVLHRGEHHVPEAPPRPVRLLVLGAAQAERGAHVGRWGGAHPRHATGGRSHRPPDTGTGGQ